MMQRIEGALRRLSIRTRLLLLTSSQEATRRLRASPETAGLRITR